jgi:hypothetical protein
MNRRELSEKSRDELIALAETRNVTRARYLTRDELIDELLLIEAGGRDATSLKLARGFFGLARDLLARVVERGLHLPDAATRIRGSVAPPPPRHVEAPIPTVTLAHIYANQGHTDRAVETLHLVLQADGNNEEAKALLTHLTGQDYEAPPPPPPEQDDDTGPAGHSASAEMLDTSSTAPSSVASMLDDAPLPERYDVDECVALPVDPTTLFVYWEMREATLRYLQHTRGPGHCVLRVAKVSRNPSAPWDGPTLETTDIDVHAPIGDYYLRSLPRDAVIRVAIGYKTAEAFIPTAHSPLFLDSVPRGTAPTAEREFVHWTLEGTRPLSAGELPGFARMVKGAAGVSHIDGVADAAGVRVWDFTRSRAGASELAAYQWGGSQR